MRAALVHMRHAGTGGTERYLELVARALGEAGHEAVIVCRSHEALPHPAARFEVLRPFAIGGALRLWSFARAVERHVARNASSARPYDVVFGLGKTWTHDVVRLGGGCHATYLERAHESTRADWERLVGKGVLKHRLALAAERRALSPGAYRAVIANSRMVQRDVVQRYGVPADRVHVVYNGVDLTRFRPDLREGAGLALRRELGLGDEALVLLFLGTGYGRKGLAPLLRAFARVADARPTLHLVVVGYDSRRAHYEQLARELGVASRTRFLGGRRDTEVCYAAADLYAVPTWYDPFANTTLEALASGLPVITTSGNGAGELIEEGVEGSVLASEPSADALEPVLSEWSSRERVEGAREAARAVAARHSAARVAAESIAVLELVRNEKLARPAAAQRAASR